MAESGKAASMQPPTVSDPHPEPVDRRWDDEGVIPDDLSPDSEYLFARMGEETLRAVDPGPGDRVLDVGCGRGIDLARLAGRDARLCGFDGSLVMIHKADQTFRDNGCRADLACGSAERLPYTQHSFDRVYCKGAIDHFYDPAAAIAEMVRVLRPGGSLVISVANFESLGCRLGRILNRIRILLTGREMKKPHFWEIPEDHVHKFDRRFLLGMLPAGLKLELERGISLLWGFPKWGAILRRLPERTACGVLRALDRLARTNPALADVIVIRARRQTEAPGDPSHRT